MTENELSSIYGDIPGALKKVIRQKNKVRRLTRRFPSEANMMRAKELEEAVKRRLREHAKNKWDSRELRWAALEAD